MFHEKLNCKKYESVSFYTLFYKQQRLLFIWTDLTCKNIEAQLHTLAFDSPRFTWAIASSLSPIEWLEYLRFLDGESMTTKWLKPQDIFVLD